jgi:signal peptidase I
MSGILDWIKDIVIALIIGALLLFFIKPTIVKEHSMLPTLNENNYLFVSRQSYHLFGSPQRGDIIVFESDLKKENGGNKWLIKRVIGLPGDTVEIVGGLVYLNGVVLDEPYILDGWTSGTVGPLTVPEESLFVMGDNRLNSADSRVESIGCISYDRLIGKAVLRLYPFSEIGGLYESLEGSTLGDWKEAGQ